MSKFVVQSKSVKRSKRTELKLRLLDRIVPKSSSSELNVNDLPCRKIIKEGWLKMRGKYIKTWHTRYFILFENGDLLGFQRRSASSKPRHVCTVKSCDVIYEVSTFLFKKSSCSQRVDQIFHFSTPEEQQSWISAMDLVGNKPTETQELEKIPKSGSKPSLDDYEFLKILGEGSFGKVFLCREKSTRNLRAMKVLEKYEIVSSKAISRVETEQSILKSLNHPFVISLKCSFQTPSSLCFVTEYANGGSLSYHTRGERRFPEDRARFYAAEIVLGLEYLHAKNIFYRDLKLANVLIDGQGHVKLADFGLSEDNFPADKTITTSCGTLSYMAPEVVIKGCNSGRTADWWSLGVSVFKMMCGRLPFGNKNRTQIYDSILKDEVKFSNKISEEAKGFVKGLLTKDPQARLGANGAEEVKGHGFFSGVNWKDLSEKKIEPPFVPKISWDTDTRYFSKKFTSKAFPHPDAGKQSCEGFIDFEDFSYVCEDDDV